MAGSELVGCVDGLVNLAAPGGSAENPIPSAIDDSHYATSYGTSQATAFVGGLAAAMLSCWPDKYRQAKGSSDGCKLRPSP